MLRNALLAKPGLLDKQSEVALRRILHEQIQVVLIGIEHASLKCDDVAVVERGQQPHFVDRIAALVLAHAEAADLGEGGVLF